MASLQKQIYDLVGLERLRLKPDAKVGSLVNLAMRRSSLDALHVFVIFRKAGPRKTVRMISQAWAAKQMNDRDHFKLSHGPALKFKPSPRVNESKWRSAERLFEPLESRLQTKLNAKPSSCKGYCQENLLVQMGYAHASCA